MALLELEASNEGRWAANALGLLRRVSTSMWRWVRHKQAMALLAHLDEHMRRDIGLEPAETAECSLLTKPHLRPDFR